MAGSACSTPFVSAPSTPARDPSFDTLAAAGFHSLPASPVALGVGDDEYGCEMGFEFDFDFSSQFPSPALEEMSSADELFHNGQIRPMRLVSSFLLRPSPLVGEAPAASHRPEPAAASDERGRSARRRRSSRSHSPFRLSHCLSPGASSGDPPAASRSSSSSSTASSASSSSSSRRHQQWRFLKDLLRRSSSDGNGKHHHHPPPLPPPPAASKRNPSSPATRGRTRNSTHARVYEARRAEAEEIRRRTFLPYRQGLLLGCLGLGSRGSFGAMAAAGKSSA
ncbi:hypothetical protein PR202_gb23500 [Eleusine coracana subsp. coracana]|uniref:Calmodulin-binding protein n=1 Tax=Eleusine coracana subsp. coracana TaxID=191504 RepID=A0AAV5FJ40_ELECO|nr:hypothetical protein QOZ80_5BG0441960 [Eleusine coracana subsp. coracana]GJN34804.1 hypothetical protein PR202_gb23500 [Eleusine coracana subsp. coracana]